MLFWQFIQYESGLEWKAVKDYANVNGVSVVGDMPLYVALDSVDVWEHPELFKLDENFVPTKKAGVPPDYFCADGQLWGNPVYNYDVHRENGFQWWIRRLKHALSNFNLVRIDHFRGFDKYYEVDGNATNARCGEWIKVPSQELFYEIGKRIHKSRIIAEDLGIIDEGVTELLQTTGYAGMKVLSFAFNGEPKNPYLPENIGVNSICYTGTHDNDTLQGLISHFSEWDYGNFTRGVQNSMKLLSIKSNGNYVEDVLKLGFACKSKIFITTMQDILELGSDYRINEPGTVKQQNWAVMFNKKDFSVQIAKKLLNYTKQFSR